MFIIICVMELHNMFYNAKLYMPILISIKWYIWKLVAKKFHWQINKLQLRIALIEYKFLT
jgi:hypothetical protein